MNSFYELGKVIEAFLLKKQLLTLLYAYPSLGKHNYFLVEEYPMNKQGLDLGSTSIEV